jgi:WXG100 family type VII secretion target
MEQTAKQFESVDAELQNTLSGLKQKVADLQAAWSGRGSVSFQQVMEAWSRDQAALNTLLRETAQLIRSSGHDYGAVDESAAARLSRSTGNGPVYQGL